MINKIKETCIYVKNLEATHEFYEAKLGLQFYSSVPGSHVFFKVGSTMLLCFLNEASKKQTSLPPHFANGQIHFALEVAKNDYESYKANLISRGIAIEHEHTWKENVKSFYFRDPDKHLVEIIMPGLWE